MPVVVNASRRSRFTSSWHNGKRFLENVPMLRSSVCHPVPVFPREGFFIPTSPCTQRWTPVTSGSPQRPLLWNCVMELYIA